MANSNDLDFSQTISEQSVPYLQRALTSEAYQQTIHRVASDLKRRERHFSRIIHTPFIEPLGNLLAHTLMRTSGLLGAGIAGLLGMTLLFVGHSNEQRYGFSVFILLLSGGFLAGLLTESMTKFRK